jgi:beta-glucosidase/6-phospho-beta-glucosidase/beta-galactosidase
MGEAIADGVDLSGYTSWGYIDLLSASTGEMYDLFMSTSMMMVVVS